MHHAVYVVVENKKGNSVQRDDCHEAEHLLVEIAAILSQHQNSQRCGAAPVRLTVNTHTAIVIITFSQVFHFSQSEVV